MNPLLITTLFIFLSGNFLAQEDQQDFFADKILDSEVFQQAKNEVEIFSDNTRTLSLVSLSSPTVSEPFYLYRACENSGIGCVTYFYFGGYPSRNRLTLYEPGIDMETLIEEFDKSLNDEK